MPMYPSVKALISKDRTSYLPYNELQVLNALPSLIQKTRFAALTIAIAASAAFALWTLFAVVVVQPKQNGPHYNLCLLAA